MESNKHSVGKTIARLRRERGWTQIELGRRLCVSDKTVSKWEMENGYPEITLIPVIAELFGISIDYLLTGATPTRTDSTDALSCDAALTPSAVKSVSEDGSENASISGCRSDEVELPSSDRYAGRGRLAPLLAGVAIGALIALVFTLFLPLYRRSRASKAFADGDAYTALEIYTSLGALCDSYREAEIASAVLALGEVDSLVSIARLTGAGVSVIVGYETDGGILCEGEQLTGGNPGNPVGVRRILYQSAPTDLPDAVRTGYDFLGWEVKTYEYNINDENSPLRLTLGAIWGVEEI